MSTSYVPYTLNQDLLLPPTLQGSGSYSTPSWDRPSDARRLVRQRHRGDVDVFAGNEPVHPAAQPVVAVLGMPDDSPCAVHKQLPEIRVASLGDAQQPLLAASAVLTRNQSEQGGEVTSLAERRPIAERAGERCGDQRSGTAQRHQALRHRILGNVSGVGGLLDRTVEGPGPVIVAMIEDPGAVAAFGAPCKARVHPRLAALAFGSEDMALAMRAAPDSPVVTSRFHALAGAAAALGLPLLGFPGSIAEFRDLEAFAASAAASAASGAVGAFCIHPAQVAPLHDAFGVGMDAVEWARRVVEAFEAAGAGGSGAVSLDGAMIDRPVYLRARGLLARALSRDPARAP